MKRVITILLLIVFAYSYLGAGFFYNIWLYSIKEQVKEKLESEFPEEVKVIKIPKSWEDNPPQEFKWHEEHEFRYHGQMYDVIDKESHGNQIWYYCYWDKAETELLNNLSKYVSNYLSQQPDQQEKSNYLKIILEKTFLLFESKTEFDLILRASSVVFQPKDLTDTILDIDLPPPRIAISR